VLLLAESLIAQTTPASLVDVCATLATSATLLIESLQANMCGSMQLESLTVHHKMGLLNVVISR
jgi:hypothetical protein